MSIGLLTEVNGMKQKLGTTICCAGLALSCAVHAASNSSGPTLGDEELNKFQVALVFHTCIESETGKAMDALKASNSGADNEVEGRAWRKVSGTCIDTLSSRENDALVYRAYKGDISKMLAFKEGLIVSERAYAFSLLIGTLQSAKP
jgi:hypothetical protein